MIADLVLVGILRHEADDEATRDRSSAGVGGGSRSHLQWLPVAPAVEGKAFVNRASRNPLCALGSETEPTKSNESHSKTTLIIHSIEMHDF